MSSHETACTCLTYLRQVLGCVCVQSSEWVWVYSFGFKGFKCAWNRYINIPFIIQRSKVLAMSPSKISRWGFSSALGFTFECKKERNPFILRNVIQLLFVVTITFLMVSKLNQLPQARDAATLLKLNYSGFSAQIGDWLGILHMLPQAQRIKAGNIHVTLT